MCYYSKFFLIPHINLIINEIQKKVEKNILEQIYSKMQKKSTLFTLHSEKKFSIFHSKKSVFL
jgi:hypothetical protein